MATGITYPRRHTLPSGLADRLRRVRMQRGLGLREAARQVGISPGYLCLLEQGKRCPSLVVAQDLIDCLRPVDELVVALLSIARPDAGRSNRPWRARSAFAGR